MKEKLDIIIYTIAKLLVAGIGVLLVSVETELFTPDILGDYSLVSGLVSVFVSFSLSWIGSSALRYYDEYKSQRNLYNKIVVMMTITMAVVLLLAIWVVSMLLPTIPLKESLILVLLMALTKGVFEVYEKILRVSCASWIYSVCVVLQSIVNILLIYALSSNLDGKISVLYFAVIISTGLFDAFAFGLSKSQRGLTQKELSFEPVKQFCLYGFPMVGVWGISWLLNYSDRYIIGIFESNYEVGIYTTAYNITQNAIGIFISSISLAFFPALIRKWNSHGKEAATTFLNQILEYYCVFLVPAVIGLGLISNNLYHTVLDEAYVDGANIIIWSGAGFFFMGINNILYKIWQLEEKTNKVLVLMIISVVANIVLNIVCVPMWGYKAAALTTLVSYLLIFVIAVCLIKKDYAIKVRLVTCLRVVIASLVMVVTYQFMKGFIRNTLLLIGIVVFVAMIYLVVFVAIGGFKEERKMIIDKLRRTR